MGRQAIAFLEDEFNLSKKKAVLVFGAVTFVLCRASIFFIGKGVLGELDFWGGNFFLILFGTVEVILFAWVFGMDRAWTELHAGSDITLGGDSRPLLLLTGQDAPGEGRGVGGIRAARGHDLSGGVFTPGRFRCVP